MISSFVHVPVSVGELIDKITILEIKLDFAKNPVQRDNLTRELNLLDALWTDKNSELLELFAKLKHINLTIWHAEERIRQKHDAREYDQEFSSLAVVIFTNNDNRAMIKKQINTTTNSDIVEEKIYNSGELR